MMKMVSDGYVVSFLEQMHMLVEAGIPLSDSVEMILNGETDDESKKILKIMLATLYEGRSFYDALTKVAVFPDYMVKMIKVGEETGKLEETIDSLQQYYERMDRLNRVITNAVFYPLLLTIMMLTVIGILVMKVMPIFSDVYEQMGSSLSGFSRLVLVIGGFLNRYSLVLIALIMAVIVAVYMAMKSKKGRAVIKTKIADNSIYRLLIKSRVTGVLAMSLESGMDVSEALNLAKDTVNDEAFCVIHEKISNELNQGKNFNDAMEDCGLLSAVDCRLLSIGTKTGNLDKVMKQVADRNEEEFNARIEGLISKIEPSLIIVMAIITGVILLSVMIPLANVMTLIG